MPIAIRIGMRKSFTLIEVVLVIVVIGILAAVIVPRLRSSRVEDAANQILSHIRYTQHLALMDDKIDPSKKDWYKELWQIRFFKKASASADGSTPKWAYAVFSDRDSGSGYDGNPNATTGEVALEPETKKLLSGGFTISYNDSRTYKPAAIGETYNIVDVKFSSSCSFHQSKRVIFDYLGRPLRGNPQNYTQPYEKDKIVQSICYITFCFDSNSCDKNFTIAIEPESGFSYISSLNP